MSDGNHPVGLQTRKKGTNSQSRPFISGSRAEDDVNLWPSTFLLPVPGLFLACARFGSVLLVCGVFKSVSPFLFSLSKQSRCRVGVREQGGGLRHVRQPGLQGRSGVLDGRASLSLNGCPFDRCAGNPSRKLSDDGNTLPELGRG